MTQKRAKAQAKPTQAPKQKSAIILSGGGADSAYGVGVMRALFPGRCPAHAEEQLDPEVLAGTSAGAFAGAFLSARAEKEGMAEAIERLTEVYLERIAEGSRGCGNGVFRYRIDPLQLADPRCFLSQPLQQVSDLARDGASLGREAYERVSQFLKSDAPLERRTLGLVNLSSFFCTEPFRKTIQDNVDFESLRRSRISLKITATAFNDGKLEIFSNADCSVDVIMASAAIPGFFPPVQIGSDLFVDGGVLMNTPLSPAIQAGANTLYVIYFDPDVKRIPLPSLDNTIDTLYRVQVISWAAKINDDISDAAQVNRLLLEPGGSDPLQAIWPNKGKRHHGGVRPLTIHRFHPRDDLGGALGLLNFDRSRLESLIQRGYQDALKHDCDESQCVIADPGAY